MRYSGEHKAQTRARILAEAAKAIRADGVERVSVKTLMDGVGLTHGGFYAHFSSKDDLVAHAIGHMFEERYHSLVKHLEDGDAAERLGSFIDSYLSMTHRDGQAAGCPLPALATELPRLSPAGRKALAAGAMQLRLAVQSLLERLGRDDAEERAVYAVGEMIGAVILARVAIEVADAGHILQSARYQLHRQLELTK
jgi:TetR/AcrR family transcriptional repressor of nem operon